MYFSIKRHEALQRAYKCIVLLKCASFWWSCPFWSMPCFVERYKVPKRTWSLEYDMIFFSTKRNYMGHFLVGQYIKCWKWICLGVCRVWCEICSQGSEDLVLFLKFTRWKMHTSLRCVAIRGLWVESQVGFSSMKLRLFTQEDTSPI